MFPSRRLADIGHVSLIREAHDEDLGPFDLPEHGQALDRHISHVLRYRIVDRTTGKDHLGVVADFFGLLDKAVGVDGDASRPPTMPGL